ncbi:MAG: hypothetical protein P1P90_06715 [Patescibacteria group bacterium]|nr:hypothetical protein [Patescibacteria group bacterium]
MSNQLLKNKSESTVVNDGAGKNRRRMFLVSSCLVLVVVLFFVIEPTLAVSETSMSKTIINWAIGGIAKVIVWIAEQLGYILIFLIELLINVVQYNNFVKATPVQIGWPLIRDTVNMFFIVIVLVSAFATIIGYPKDFRYKDVLPKLLIMAILINFSKTIIGLLIDFSQVIVLTFVNGFKQAAGGNFVQALGIAKIMRLSDTTGTIQETADGEIEISISGAASPWSLMNIVVASIFAIWIISISITLILIMLIFFLARIIMLWFLLITSPVAFFAWSLPGSIKGALGSFTNEWWSRLSAALVGGPTMAFFLWLSLAMAQRQSDLIGPGGIYDDTKVSTEVTQFQQSTNSQQNVTPSEFGDPKVFATFIIMVAFMLLGVQTSVKFASSVAPGTEKLVGTLASSKAGFGVAAGVVAGRFAGRGIAGGAKLAGKGALAVGREAEARTGIVAGGAKKLQKSGMFAYAPISMQKAVGGLAAAPKKAAEEKAKVMKDIMAGLSPMERDEYLAKAIATKGKLSRKSDLAGLQLARAENATTPLFAESAKKANTEQAVKEIAKEKGLDPENLTKEQIETIKKENKSAVTARAAALTKEIRSQRLAEARDAAIDSGDEALLKKVNDQYEKDPSLITSGSKQREKAIDLANNTEDEKQIKADAHTSALMSLNYMHEKKWIDENGRMIPGTRDNAEFKKFNVGTQGRLAMAHLEYAKSTPEAAAKVRSLITGKTADGKDMTDEDYEKNNYRVSLARDADGVEKYVVMPTQNIENRFEGRFDNVVKDPKKIVKDESTRERIAVAAPAMGDGIGVADIAREMSQPVATALAADLESLAGKSPAEVEEKRAKMGEEYLQHDVSAKFLFNLDSKTGNFADDAGRKAFEDTANNIIKKITEDGDYSQKTISALSSLAKQVGTQGEAFKLMQQAMRNMSQGQILNTMNAGIPAQKTNIRSLFIKVVDQADRDKEDGMTDSPAINIRESAIKPPPIGSDAGEFKTASAVHRILFEGK